MRKFLISLIFITGLLFIACGSKKDEFKEKNEEAKATHKVAANFTGEGNYIIENQTYDYEQFGIKLYDHNGVLKLPFETLGQSEVVLDEQGNYLLKNVKKEEVQKYIANLGADGILVRDYDDGILGHKYAIFRDNMKILLIYFEEKEELYFYIYIGNVIGERTVSCEDAKTLIEGNNLIRNIVSDEDEYNEYYIIAIQSDSVYEKGYYEFLILDVEMDWKYEAASRKCIYMITDGKNINLFEEGIIDLAEPTNANIIQKDGQEILVCTCVKLIGGEGENSIGNVIKEYVLENAKFVFDKETYTGACVANGKRAIICIENGKIEIITLVQNEDTDSIVKNGKKSWWIK